MLMLLFCSNSYKGMIVIKYATIGDLVHLSSNSYKGMIVIISGSVVKDSIAGSNSYKGMIVIWLFLHFETWLFVAIPIKEWLLSFRISSIMQHNKVAIPIKEWLL